MDSKSDDTGSNGAERTSARATRALAVLVAALAIGGVWLMVGRSDSENGRAAPDTTAARSNQPKDEHTIYGCKIVPLDGSVAPDAKAVEPYCTDTALIAEHCAVPRSTIEVPPLRGSLDGALTSTYAGTDGQTVGSLITYTGSSGPLGASSTLVCSTGATVNFSAADWEQFNEPAPASATRAPSVETAPSKTTVPRKEILSPATTPPAAPLCDEPLIETANGNADPLFCADGALNVSAWVNLATSNLSLLALGPDATAQEVSEAICEDAHVSSNPIATSAFQVAAAYYGWAFDNDPTTILYEENGCTR